MIIVIGGEKGGTGKTALTINLAVCMQYRGYDCLIVDGDKQRSSAKWAERRAQLAALATPLPSSPEQIIPIVCVEKRGDMLATLQAMKSKYDHILVDVAGAETPQLRSALVAADHLLSPMIPSECDWDTAEEINHLIDIIRSTGNSKLTASVVLNQCSTNVHTRDREQLDAATHLERFANLPIAKTRIYQRDVFRKSYTARRGIIELAVSSNKTIQKAAMKSTLELWQLYEEVTGDLVVKDLFGEQDEAELRSDT